MRYRPLDANGDYTVGRPFLANSPACVAQAVLTRLKLWKGEWFLDVTDGTPYQQEILGQQPTGIQDAAIKQRILGTPGVTSLASYSSVFNGKNRMLTISATINTQYGQATISGAL